MGATIVLGCDDPSEAFAHDEVCVETPEAPNRFTQAPGGTATVVLGGAVMQKPHDPLRQAPGGSATIVLGGDPTDPHDTFCATSTNEKLGNTVTAKSIQAAPTPSRIRQSPGGEATIC